MPTQDRDLLDGDDIGEKDDEPNEVFVPLLGSTFQ